MKLKKNDYEQCGTPNGYLRHFLADEKACEACLDARNIYTRQRRFRLGHYHDPTRCRQCGSAFPAEHACHMGTALDSTQT